MMPEPEPSVAPAVAVEGLVKRYGEVEAVRGIDFAVALGETFGFLGEAAVIAILGLVMLSVAIWEFSQAE